MGNNGEIFKLADGSVWEVKYEYEYMYEYYPTVIICPSRGLLVINDESLNVIQISGGVGNSPSHLPQPSSPVIESQIDGESEGWEGETIIKLINGQIWQQSEYYYRYRYSYRPRVLIYRDDFGFKMKIKGIEKSVRVVRLR